MSNFLNVMAGAAATFAVCAPLGAFAQERLPQTLNMPCVQAQNQVTRYGAVLLATGPSEFNRYVAGRQYCALGESAKISWVPASDTFYCPVGYRCAPPSNTGGL